MSKGVRIKIPEDRQEGEKQNPDDHEYYLDHDEAADMMVYIAEQMAKDRIEGREMYPDYDAMRSEASSVIAEVKWTIIKKYG